MIPVGILPEDVEWCVAGGWAACPPLAMDQDVWVLQDPHDTETAEELRERLLVHLKQHFGFSYIDRVEEQTKVVQHNGPDASDSDPDTLWIHRVAKLYVDGRDMHILIARCMGERHLISVFDISTHSVAITSNGRVIHGEKWTPCNVPPVKLRDTPTTDGRMVKIAARYGHTPKAGQDIG